MNILKIVVVSVLFLLTGGYYYLTRAEEVHWIEEAVLQDGRTLNVQRTVALTYSKGGELSNLAHKWPHYYSLKVSHPDTGKLIEWNGDYGFNPVLLDFFDGNPYLVILQFDVFANLKQYGCPQIPYVFFRYDVNKKHWDQISGSVFPSTLSHANLTVSYDFFYTLEGVSFTKADVARRNEDAEGVETGGYFTNIIPKDFNSWTFKHKNEERKGHYKDGCHLAPEVISAPPLAQQVNLEVIEKKDYEPEWVIKNADEPASPWQQLFLDKNRSEICKTLLRPEDPQVQGWDFFLNDLSGQKKFRVTGPLICDTDAVWAFDYVVEKGRLVIAKYKSNGDLAYRISFAKPDEPGWYLGSIMQPTLKSENGYLFFEWWNLNHSGHDVHVKRSMKVKIQEPINNNLSIR